MVPAPHSIASKPVNMASGPPRQSVVISGMPGSFPKSNTIKEFTDILYNKVDPIANVKVRWEFNHPEVPDHHGKVPDLCSFDAQFFKINNHLAKCMDPMARKLLEHTYRAIYDAGLSADYFAGKNVGVYIGSSIAEMEKVCVYDRDVSAHTMPGCSKAMFANRISYWLDVKGPSMSVDDMCCTSVVAVEQAYKAILRGDCEAAIVGASHVGLHPHTVMQYGRMMKLCKDGKNKSFDQNADGSAKSDAISVILLQKADVALRIYAEIVHVKSEFAGYNEEDATQEYGFIRNCNDLVNFYKKFYSEAGVPPNSVEYVEAFGCGISEVDKNELEAIEKAFCGNRQDPLLVGSVTSNIGYTEAATGLSALTKATEAPKPSIPYLIPISGRNESSVQKAIDDLKSRPVDHQELALLYNIHEEKNIGHLARGYVILDTDQENKTSCLSESASYFDDVKRPLWFVYSGMGSQWPTMGAELMRIPIFSAAIERCRQALAPKGIDIVHIITANDKTIFDNILHSFVGIAAVQIGLTDVLREMGIVPDKIIGHSVGELGCAYADGCFTAEEMILSAYSRGLVSLQTELIRGSMAAVGIGYQQEMILSAYSRGLVSLQTELIRGSMAAVGIGYQQEMILSAYSRGLVSLQTELIRGSMAAVGIGYQQEMILSAYSRGLVSLQTELIRGSMAAVGIGYQQAVKLCPPEIDVACHNGPESCTISGPAEKMKEFVAKLVEMGIFAKEVPCSNIAYHSRYIADAGPKLLEYLSAVIKNPKKRSERWLSTSVPQERWGEENAQYCSAWYHTNNLLSPVLFEETSKLIPAGAVLVEIAPHGLLQAIVKRSLHPDCRHVPLTRRGHADNALHVLEAVGKLFAQGYNPKVKCLYPKVEFPVSTETPTLSHLVEWNDSDKWPMPYYKPVHKEYSCICNFLISIHDDEHSYLQGHVVGGKTQYPFSAVLVAVWDMLAMLSGVKRKEVSVQFRDVHLYAQPVLLDRRYLKLRATIHQGTGEFEVVDGLSRVATGFVTEMAADDDVTNILKQPMDTNSEMTLDSNIIYNLFQERNYSYSGAFRSVHKSNDSFTEAQLIWNDNYTTLIDGMMQLCTLQRGQNTMLQPNHIHRLSISLKDHDVEKMKMADGKTLVASSVSTVYDWARCGGILMEKLRFDDIPATQTSQLKISKLQYVPKRILSSDGAVTEAPGGEYFVPWEGKEANVKEAALRSVSVGDLDTMRWVETPRQPEKPGVVSVTVQYAGINVLDANVATGVVPAKQGNAGYGMDFSGTSLDGIRMMGIVRNGSASTTVNAVPGLTWPVPAQWSLEDAATVPLAYAQAFYCLGIKTRLLPGMSILVQGGTGALGQAIISLALAHKCKVFATVRDDKKKDFLLKLFPELTEDVIGYSRDHSFADLVMLATNGAGCDLVICCARGELKNTTLKCGAFCGIIIDTEQAHSTESFSYGMNFLTNQRSYVLVDFYNIFDNQEYINLIHSMMSDGIARGHVKPLSRVTYEANEASRAFRLLASSRHRGRVLLRIPRDVTESYARLTCSPNLYQLVVCNEKDISIQFVDRLVKCGARNILLLCNTQSQWFRYKTSTWKKLGVKVQTAPRDKHSANELAQLVGGKHIEGIFIITSEDNQDGAILTNLDKVSRSLSAPLKYFTISCGAKNTAGEKLCTARAQMQLPGAIIYLLPHKEDTYVAQDKLMDIIDRAITCEQGVLKLHLVQTNPNIFKKIVKIADLDVPWSLNENTTLRSLGLNRSYCPAIAAYLQKSCNISVDVQKVPELTIKLIRQFEEQITEPDFEESAGMKSFFSYVDRNEILGVAEIVTIPTLFRNLTVRDNMIDINQQYLNIVPGLEGHHERFRSLCERLQVPALVLQPGADNPNETVPQLAHRYVKALERRTGLTKQNTFSILGYETGIFTALEMAAIFESKGMSGTVFYVGGTPEQMSLTLKNKLKDFTSEDELQNAVLKQMITLLCNTEIDTTEFSFEGITWPKKLEKTIQFLANNSPSSTQYCRALIEASYDRIKHNLSYKIPSYKLKSKIVVINSSDVATKVSSGQDVYTIEVTLKYAVKHPKCAAIVNRHLNTEEYEAQNHCDFLFDNELFVSKFTAAQEDDD
ncbi:acyl transferase domain-containing protein [Phthorimaea operculella]|nr:acyl transferase domain-containing protein [Phthorimaea operculella]